MSEHAGTVRDRLVPFVGAHNFRDLGGYPSSFGGSTRWGVLYRAGSLHEMTPADRALFGELGVVTVVDLRRDEELSAAPDPVPSVHLCLMSHVFEQVGRPELASFVEHDDGVEFMRSLYHGLLAHAAPAIGRLVETLAAPGALPAVFHCTAGKDRTGLVAALLLRALGVDRETVLDDFELTDRYVSRHTHAAMFERMVAHGMGPEAAAGMFAAARPSMASALDEIDDVHGGAERYLVERAGVDPATVVRLRELLLG
jgi:protein-tyrosine phosphatase